MPGHGYVDPNWPNPGGPNDVPVIIYGYTPSFALAVLADVIFFIFFIIHLWQVARYRSWYFVTFPIGLVLEVVGYVARTLSARADPYHLIFFVLQYFFIVTAPVLFSAALYAVLSGLIRRLGRAHAVLPPRAILRIFIASDVVATATQITGAALIGVRQGNREDPTIGSDILLAGLAFQVFAMGIFVILTTAFLARAGPAAIKKSGLAAFVAAFSAATLLVYLRTCFRLAETVEGLDGNLSSHELYFGVLEFAPVVVAVTLMTVWHPGRCVGNRISGTKSEETERGPSE